MTRFVQSWCAAVLHAGLIGMIVLLAALIGVAFSGAGSALGAGLFASAGRLLQARWGAPVRVASWLTAKRRSSFIAMGGVS